MARRVKVIRSGSQYGYNKVSIVEWRRTQVVRERSAKPLCIGSNPIGAFLKAARYRACASRPALFMRSDSIHDVVRILRKEIRQWPVPALGHYLATPYTVLISCLLSL